MEAQLCRKGKEIAPYLSAYVVEGCICFCKMLNKEIENSVASLKMATEEQYRQQAACYRSSEEYSKMLNLYPTMQDAIESCRNESLIA